MIYILLLASFLFSSIHAQEIEIESFFSTDIYPLVSEDPFNYAEEDSCYCWGCDCNTQEPLFNKVALGPQVYNVTRTRVGGSRQQGNLYGLRACYDRIKPFGFYVGIECLYGEGTLEGKLSDNSKLRSTLTDRLVEGRLGFTFQSCECHHPAFTPFVGYGYFDETNKYRTPMQLRFCNYYDYIAVGFLSSIDINAWLQIGLNLKGRLMWAGGHCLVSDDPEFEDEKLLIGSRFNYRLELPILYQSYGECYRFGCGVVPFYEKRHYGGTENFPHDFFDTRLNIYGAVIEATFQL